MSRDLQGVMERTQNLLCLIVTDEALPTRLREDAGKLFTEVQAVMESGEGRAA